jgi:hypothetical protein
VRHAIEAAAYATLVRLNAAHLRMSVIARAGSLPVAEPPSHRWYELMSECFGQDHLLLLEVDPPRNGEWRDTYSQVVPGEKYSTREAEERTIRRLLVAAGTFLVAESTTLGNQIEQWGIAGRNPSLCEELRSLVDRAGAGGLVLFRHAEAGTWRDLLFATTGEPAVVIANPSQDYLAADPAGVVSATNSRHGKSTAFRDRVQALASLGRVRGGLIAAAVVSALVGTGSVILMAPPAPALDVVAYGVTTPPPVGAVPCGPGKKVVFTFTIKASGSGTLHYVWQPDKGLSQQPVRADTITFTGPPQTKNVVYAVPYSQITGPQTGMKVQITSPESFRGASYEPNKTVTCE